MFWIIKYSSDKLNGIKNILFDSSRSNWPKKVNSSSFLEALDLSLSIVNTSLLQSNFNPQNLPYQEPQVEHLFRACKNKWSKKVWVGQFNWPPVIYCCWLAYNYFVADFFCTDRAKSTSENVTTHMLCKYWTKHLLLSCIHCMSTESRVAGNKKQVHNNLRK